MTHSYDPQLAEVLPHLPLLDYADATTTREVLRAARAARGEFELPDGVTQSAHSVPAGDDEITVHVFHPRDAVDAPALLWFHGGGFVIGDALMDAALCAALAEHGLVVASVDYHLAPERVYPTQTDEAYAALRWLADSAVAFGVDPARIAVGGQSAGGCLAAAVTQIARDRRGPRVAFQALDIPVLDDRQSTDSMAYDDTPYWTRADASGSWSAYLGATAIGDAPYAAPARREDLTGLPPAYVAVAQFDPLRDEGIEYARRLAQADVPTELHLYPGTFHGSVVVSAADVSRRMRAELVDAVVRGVSA